MNIKIYARSKVPAQISQEIGFKPDTPGINKLEHIDRWWNGIFIGKEKETFEKMQITKPFLMVIG